MAHAPPIPETRTEARTMGLRFYAGVRCPTHPTSPRYAANGRCAECCKAERKAGQEAGRARDAERKRMARLAAASASPVGSIVAQILSI